MGKTRHGVWGRQRIWESAGRFDQRGGSVSGISEKECGNVWALVEVGVVCHTRRYEIPYK